MKKKYKRLYDHAKTIKTTNPGSLVEIKTNLLVQDEVNENCGGHEIWSPKVELSFRFKTINMSGWMFSEDCTRRTFVMCHS